ncbi:cytochrome c biogenesis protein [Carboxylicivirga marina]|uniref:cytochrome c biogenesis protein n=1 Tax=Carboxylicivirga marina TaxID=2800988 RepID=UPI0025980720|nr:cytochrome c biogenesis protein CcsA [uncultured Carboxylicivirga sp.]
MKQIIKAFFSTKVSVFLLLLFVLVIAAATVVEELYDTPTAKLLIYNAWWFEMFMLLFGILYLVNVFQNKLFKLQKLPVLIFHISFILLIIGGGITRYKGYEANMHINEAESTNTIYTAEPFFQINFPGDEMAYTSDQPIYFPQVGQNDFHLKFNTQQGTVEITYKRYVFEAYDLFRDKVDAEVVMDYYKRNSRTDSPDALYLELTHNDKQQEVIVFYDRTRYIQPFMDYNIGDLTIEMTYGPKPMELPFSLLLKDFVLSKYPGTEIPSASESRVLLIDERHDYRQEHILAKNKVLDYEGYRFFQTSYDDDEKGTILSLNYDYWGTRITYLGYLLMTIGAILILLSKNSHFSQLNKKIQAVRRQRKSLITVLTLLFTISNFSLAQNNIQKPISNEHAERFGHLLVQTYEGRFTSVHSLASDVAHKLTGKDHFNFEGKGEMDAMHLFLDLHLDPNYWRNQKLFVVKEKSIRNMIGLSGKQASFVDFFDKSFHYKLEQAAQSAFKTDPSEQSTLDREIIKITEKVNIFQMLINGDFLKLFPVEKDVNNKWVHWRDSLALKPLTGKLAILNEDLRLQELNYSNMMRAYFVSTLYARESDDYSVPHQLIGYIKSIQRQLTPHELLPSEKKIGFEVLYNKLRIFDRLKFVYGVLGIILLVLALIDNFRATPGRANRYLLKVFTALFIAAFAWQTVGMGLRWYLGGHAPWSNGYEVLLLVAWGSIISGLSVIRYSKIVLASTAILASVLLMVAGLSYYDPQLTNLNPVLKSYWLIIHVAIITIGYGFLALGFIIGLINICLYLLRPKGKSELFSLVIKELTLINEKLLTIGMFLTAIGTFIGCVWANESWGNYWSWNAKQSWSLIIVLVYATILHFRYIPALRSRFAFNVATIISFGTVIMTFVGVNYYFTKGLHSYANDDPPIFPVWLWGTLGAMLMLILTAYLKERKSK